MNLSSLHYANAMFIQQVHSHTDSSDPVLPIYIVQFKQYVKRKSLSYNMFLFVDLWDSKGVVKSNLEELKSTAVNFERPFRTKSKNVASLYINLFI